MMMNKVCKKMNINKLQEIIETKNAESIYKAFSQNGFFDMATHPILKKASLVPIARSKNCIETDWLYDKKFAFKVSFIAQVDDYSNLSFIWLQINKYDRRLDMFIPHIQRIYAKEKKEN